jgi:hypothetical protein
MEGIVNEVLNSRKTCGSIPTYIVNAAREVTTLRRPYSGGRSSMSSKSKSTAQPAHPSTGGRDQEERPHAYNDGWVTVGQIVVDPEAGEETEEFALYLCRRCADSR